MLTRMTSNTDSCRAAREPDTMAAPSLSLAKANSVFSLDLFKTLNKKDKKANIFYSPFSISSALSMVLLGARGKTAEEMCKVLGFCEGDLPDLSGGQQTNLMQQMQMPSLPPQFAVATAPATANDVHAKFGELLKELTKADAPYALSVANKLYGEQSFQFLQEFLTEVDKYYGAELEPVDFMNNAEGARVKINNWVEKNTQDKIKDLLPKDSLGDLTKLVLINAIYFKAKWDQPFQKHKTIKSPFFTNKIGPPEDVLMMCQDNKFPHRNISEIKAQVLEMPYQSKDLSMIILLPDEVREEGEQTTGLEQLERELTHQNFVNWTRPDLMEHRLVKVKIPIFKLEETYELKDILQEMGMLDTFTPMSDLTGMSSNTNLVVSKVVHKAFVEVNEAGTEAAAATAITVELTSAYIDLHTFIADHPFLFFLRHNPSMTVLFSGRFCSPESAEKM